MRYNRPVSHILYPYLRGIVLFVTGRNSLNRDEDIELQGVRERDGVNHGFLGTSEALARTTGIDVSDHPISSHILESETSPTDNFDDDTPLLNSMDLDGATSNRRTPSPMSNTASESISHTAHIDSPTASAVTGFEEQHVQAGDQGESSSTPTGIRPGGALPSQDTMFDDGQTPPDSITITPTHHDTRLGTPTTVTSSVEQHLQAGNQGERSSTITKVERNPDLDQSSARPGGALSSQDTMFDDGQTPPDSITPTCHDTRLDITSSADHPMQTGDQGESLSTAVAQNVDPGQTLARPTSSSEDEEIVETVEDVGNGGREEL
ncbi:hypothetical protein VNI00_006060 [Paramarasmius palmivorus]|uniref:Uncharacterized protein n=1 Tax=Paramarasmius palmivorus TaxID=297713 RepID=A0AAW0DEF2_9AGAR